MDLVTTLPNINVCIWKYLDDYNAMVEVYDAWWIDFATKVIRQRFQFFFLTKTYFVFVSASPKGRQCPKREVRRCTSFFLNLCIKLNKYWAIDISTDNILALHLIESKKSLSTHTCLKTNFQYGKGINSKVTIEFVGLHRSCNKGLMGQ